MESEPTKLQGYRKGQGRPARDETESAEPKLIWHPGKPENLRPDFRLTAFISFIIAIVIIVSITVYLATGPHSMHPLLP